MFNVHQVWTLTFDLSLVSAEVIGHPKCVLKKMWYGLWWSLSAFQFQHSILQGQLGTHLTLAFIKATSLLEEEYLCAESTMALYRKSKAGHSSPFYLLSYIRNNCFTKSPVPNLWLFMLLVFSTTPCYESNTISTITSTNVGPLRERRIDHSSLSVLFSFPEFWAPVLLFLLFSSHKHFL